LRHLAVAVSHMFQHRVTLEDGSLVEQNRLSTLDLLPLVLYVKQALGQASDVDVVLGLDDSKCVESLFFVHGFDHFVLQVGKRDQMLVLQEN
jgi:hypothetical protein